MLLVQPLTVAELNRELEVLEMLGDPLQVTETAPRRIYEGRQLEEHYAQFSGRVQRHQALSKQLDGLGL